MDQAYISLIGQEERLDRRTQRHLAYIIQIQMITTRGEEEGRRGQKGSYIKIKITSQVGADRQ